MEAMNGFAMITREQLIEWAQGRGWKLDRFGHLKKEQPGGTHRLKLSRIAARHEIRTPGGWTRIASGYYRNLTLTADGRLGGMTR
jgi:hypothetical protein